MNPAIATSLSSGQIEQFKRKGFLSIPRLVDDQTLEVLRAEYDRFIRGEIECGEHNRRLGGLIHQVMYPSRHSPVIRDNPAIQTAKELAAQLAGAPDGTHIRLNFDMLMDKPAGSENATPWHQDFAYMLKPMTPAGTPIPEIASMQFWLALDDVDLDNGCMQFVPGVHAGPLLPHSVVSGDPAGSGRLLALDHVDSSRAVACPLSAGGCTVHHYGTPHYTGPNTTRDRNRRAYIFNLYWHLPHDPLLVRMKKNPGNWAAATTFLWLPFLLTGYLGAERLLFPDAGVARAHPALWIYPLGCALAALFLFRFSFSKKWLRLAIIPNLAAIPLWGLALYFLHELFPGFLK